MCYDWLYIVGNYHAIFPGFNNVAARIVSVSKFKYVQYLSIVWLNSKPPTINRYIMHNSSCRVKMHRVNGVCLQNSGST